VATADTPC
jgi:hypothetical protein